MHVLQTGLHLRSSTRYGSALGLGSRVRKRVEAGVVFGQTAAVVGGNVSRALGTRLLLAGHRAQDVHALPHDLLVGGAGASHSPGVAQPGRRFDFTQTLLRRVQVQVGLLLIWGESDP